MKRIQFEEILQELSRILLSVGLDATRAQRCAYIFTENTCDGIASHGLNRFPRFVAEVKSGLVNLQVAPELVRSMGALEQWDGMRGLGLTNADTAMQRAIELSRKHSMACVGLRNTNHWMRGGTYGLQAAAAGCIGICWTNTTALMPPWGGSRKKIGNNPLVISIPNGEEPVLLDMAMSQFSNGKLEVLQRQGEKLPVAGGYNENGELTTDPGAILASSRALPIGYWKGAGLAFVLDMMASLISSGDATKDICQREQETGVSQVFMAINIAEQLGADNVNAKTRDIIESFLGEPLADGESALRFPGQNMFATRKVNREMGIPVEEALWQKILAM